MGLLLGIATGRGKSARHELQRAIPAQLWPSVLVGYYNGAEIAPLADGTAPDRLRSTEPAIAALSELLTADPLIRRLAEVETRPAQITVAPRRSLSPASLYSYLTDLWHTESSPLYLVRSGHSIDFVAPHASKTSVVERVSQRTDPKSVLCIGDQGAWPGNDSSLLSHEFSLSVDQVSSALHSCWNLAPLGTLGPAAALLYLNALDGSEGSAKILLGRLTERSS